MQCWSPSKLSERPFNLSGSRNQGNGLRQSEADPAERAEGSLFPKPMEVVSKKIHTSRPVQLQENDFFQMSQTSMKMDPKHGLEPLPRVGHAAQQPAACSSLLSCTGAVMRTKLRGLLLTTPTMVHAPCGPACAPTPEHGPGTAPSPTSHHLPRGRKGPCAGPEALSSPAPGPLHATELFLASSSGWRLSKAGSGHTNIRWA